MIFKKKSFLKKLKERLSKTRKNLATGLDKIFVGKANIDDDFIEKLEELLITSDIGIETTIELIESVSQKAPPIINNADSLKKILKEEATSFFKSLSFDTELRESHIKPKVIMVVGVNGTGKTTTIGKLAFRYSSEGKKVLITAADTFRAAAIEQLTIWARRAGAEIVKHKENVDPASVAYDGIKVAIERGTDIVLVDTAGRIHTQKNLMEELKKIKRTIGKKLPDAPHETLLVLDAITGQNALSQVKLFNESLGITSIALTKLDGTAKGGVVLNICRSVRIPLKYIGIGEQIDDLQDFDAEEFITSLFA
mmetsp:Transcript_691/g.511  ORF Transcript_691/g.511 Transcript_691/m.511 type:complete len:310 (+) Transcript_691:332-1261(+)